MLKQLTILKYKINENFNIMKGAIVNIGNFIITVCEVCTVYIKLKVI